MSGLLWDAEQDTELSPLFAGVPVRAGEERAARPKIQAGQTVWACTNCGTTEGPFVKHISGAAYCVQCARGMTR